MASSSDHRDVIAITGVSYGCGLAMAKWYLSKGHTVIGCARSQDKIQKLNEEFSSGGKNLFSVVDITDDTAVKRWAQDTVANFGAPTFLLNNGGVINENANLWEVPVDEFNKIVDINIKGTTNVLRHFVPAMIDSKRNGVIVNFTSGWGRTVSPKVAPYCATKWAIEGLSKALAMELPLYLTCVPMSPGPVNTTMLQSCHGVSRAMTHWNTQEWAENACPYILTINHSQNGISLSTPRG